MPLSEFMNAKTSYSNNILSSIKMQSVKNPDMPALICQDRSVSWARLWEKTSRLANGLLGLGLQKGDRVAILMSNRLEFPEAFLAISKGGFIVCPVNRYLKEQELEYHLQLCEASAVITSPEYVPLLEAVRPRLPNLRHVVVLGAEVASGDISYETLIGQSSPEDPPVAVSAQDVHMLLFTSGTTGRPKAAVRGYMENYHTAVSVCMEWRLGGGDIQLAVTPLYHAAPIAWFMATMISGGTFVVLPEFSPENVLAAVERHRVNWMMMVPVMFDRLLRLPDPIYTRYDLSSLRILVSGGAPLHSATKQKLRARFPSVQVIEFYGSTELGVSTSVHREDQFRKDRCVGKPMPDVELKILDERGKEVPAGEVGRLYSRGLCGFRGYWNNGQATQEAFWDNEWCTVDDLARRDDEGDYFIVDRAQDMIITGGINVYPVEIEEVLYTLEGIQEAAVIGVPDPNWGEAVKAVVVLAPDATVSEEDIIRYCKERLASFKVPKSVDFVRTIPRTQTGKILKRELRKSYWGDGPYYVS